MKQHKKVNVAAKLAARPKVYNLMVGYDPILETEIRNILKENNVSTKITTECYFYIKHLDEAEINKIRELVKNVKFEFKSPKNGNLKVYRIRYISATKAPEMNIGKIARINKKKVSGKTHSSGSKSTNIEKKVSERVKKACKYLDRVNHRTEKKKTLESAKRGKSKVTVKPIQQKLNFKAAA